MENSRPGVGGAFGVASFQINVGIHLAVPGFLAKNLEHCMQPLDVEDLPVLDR
jgi:hypothetical protein